MRKINGAGYALRLSGIELVGGGQSTAKLAALYSSIQSTLVGVEVNKILDKLKGISMDDTVTDEERAQLSATWAQIQSVYSSLAQQSADLGFTDEGSARYGAWIAAKTAFDNLSAVLAPILAGSGDQTVDGGDLYEAFQKFYQASGILGQAISSELYDQEYKIVMSLSSYEFLYNGRGMPVDQTATITATVKTTGIVGAVKLAYNDEEYQLVDGTHDIPVSAMEGRTQILLTASCYDEQTQKTYSTTALITKKVSEPASPVLINDGYYTYGNPPTTTPKGNLIEGDYFLDKESNVPYSYVGGTWVPTSGSVSNWADVLRDTLPIAISSSTTITSGSFIYAWIQTLASETAFIASLFSHSITLKTDADGNQGVISSEGYSEDGTDGWMISSNGKAVFNNVEIRGFGKGLGIQIRNGTTPSSPAILVTQQAGETKQIAQSIPTTHYNIGELAEGLQKDSEQTALIVYKGKEYSRYILVNTANTKLDGLDVRKIDKYSYVSPSSEGGGTFTYTYVTPCFASNLTVALRTQHSWKIGTTRYTENLQSHSVVVTLPDGTETTYTATFSLSDVPSGTTIRDAITVTSYKGYGWIEYGNTKNSFDIQGVLYLPPGQIYFGDDTWSSRAQIASSGYFAQADQALVVGDINSSEYSTYSSVETFLQQLSIYQKTWKCNGLATDTYSDGEKSMVGVLYVSIDAQSYTVSTATEIVRRSTATPYIKGPIALSIQTVSTENAILVSNIEFDDAHADIGSKDLPAQSIWVNNINGIPFSEIYQK